eukprot:PhM_4_TR3037/c0_g1_i2/m.93701
MRAVLVAARAKSCTWQRSVMLLANVSPVTITAATTNTNNTNNRSSAQSQSQFHLFIDFLGELSKYPSLMAAHPNKDIILASVSNSIAASTSSSSSCVSARELCILLSHVSTLWPESRASEVLLKRVVELARFLSVEDITNALIGMKTKKELSTTDERAMRVLLTRLCAVVPVMSTSYSISSCCSELAQLCRVLTEDPNESFSNSHDKKQTLSFLLPEMVRAVLFQAISKYASQFSSVSQLANVFTFVLSNNISSSSPSTRMKQPGAAYDEPTPNIVTILHRCLVNLSKQHIAASADSLESVIRLLTVFHKTTKPKHIDIMNGLDVVVSRSLKCFSQRNNDAKSCRLHSHQNVNALLLQLVSTAALFEKEQAETIWVRTRNILLSEFIAKEVALPIQIVEFVVERGGHYAGLHSNKKSSSPSPSSPSTASIESYVLKTLRNVINSPPSQQRRLAFVLRLATILEKCSGCDWAASEQGADRRCLY